MQMLIDAGKIIPTGNTVLILIDARQIRRISLKKGTDLG